MKPLNFLPQRAVAARAAPLTAFNDNDMPTEIPTDKRAARAWLEEEMQRRSIPVTRLPMLLPEPLEPEEAPVLKRRAANDNAPKDWPLYEALKRDLRTDMADLVQRDRWLVECAAVSPYCDAVDSGGNGIASARETGFKKRTVEKAAAAGWKDEDGNLMAEVPKGEIRDHGLRVVAKNGVNGTGSKAVQASDKTPGYGRMAPISRGNEADIVASIDARSILGELRAALGPLLGVYEEACLQSLTFTEMGKRRGFTGKQASAAGRALAYAAVDALAEAWRTRGIRDIVRERQAEERWAA